MPSSGLTTIDLEDGQAPGEKSKMMPASTASAPAAAAAPPAAAAAAAAAADPHSSFLGRVRASMPKFRKPNHSSLALLAAIMGNVLEFYDFSVYAYFAPEIGKLFFPNAVKTFTVFAGGFLMRPIGSIVLGAVGDKYGTGAALKWSILLMTVPTVATGCLPTYERAGLVAPLLLTLCRLLQGMSVGGELIGALLHTADHSPPEKRGFYCGVVGVFGSIGNLIGAVVSVSMRHSMSKADLLSWGWRVPFLTGSLLGFVGIFLRSKTNSLHSPEERKEKERLKTEYKAAAKAAGAAAGAGGVDASLPALSSNASFPPSSASIVTSTTSTVTAASVEEGRTATGTPSPAPSSPSSSQADSEVFDVDFVEAAIATEQEEAAAEDEDEDEGEEEEREEQEEKDAGDEEMEEGKEEAQSARANAPTTVLPLHSLPAPFSAPSSLPPSSNPSPQDSTTSSTTKKSSSSSSTTKLLRKLKLKKKERKPGKPKRKPFLQILRDGAATDKARFFHVALFAALQSAQYYLHLTWVGTYMAQLSPHPIGATTSFSVLALMQVIVILTGPLWGAVGDRYGGAKHRVEWLMAGVVASIVILPAAFSLLNRGGVEWAFAYAVISGLTMGFCLSGNYSAWVTETLKDSPARVMCTSVAYNLGAMVGGCAPMLYSALSAEKFPQMAPAYPPLVYGVMILMLFSYARFSPRGIFHVSKWVEEGERKVEEGKEGGKEVEMRKELEQH